MEINTLLKDKKIHFIFDVDGCLTPKFQVIQEQLHNIMIKLSSKHRVSIVTGSEISNSILQIGEQLINNLCMSFNCLGNVVYHNRRLIKQNFWYPEQSLISLLNQYVENSDFPYRTAKHFDLRTGTLNFSVVGRNATAEQRNEYLLFDKESGERLEIANRLLNEFPHVDVSIGGNTSLDIQPKGKNKGQIIEYLSDDYVTFFGDGYGNWGNDQPLFDAIERNSLGVAYKVDSWQETMTILSNEYKEYVYEKKYG